MFNIGPAELMVILLVALLVLGPKKLPEAARQIGRAVSEFRRVTASLQDEVRVFANEALAEQPPPAGPAVPPGPPAPEVAGVAPAPPVPDETAPVAEHDWQAAWEAPGSGAPAADEENPPHA